MARFAHNLVIRGDLCVGALSNSLIVAEKCAQSTQGNFLLQVSDKESDAAPKPNGAEVSPRAHPILPHLQ